MGEAGRLRAGGGAGIVSCLAGLRDRPLSQKPRGPPVASAGRAALGLSARPLGTGFGIQPGCAWSLLMRWLSTERL